MRRSPHTSSKAAATLQQAKIRTPTAQKATGPLIYRNKYLQFSVVLSVLALTVGIPVVHGIWPLSEAGIVSSGQHHHRPGSVEDLEFQVQLGQSKQRKSLPSLQELESLSNSVNLTSATADHGLIESKKLSTKNRAIIVTGLESSGTKEVAKIFAHILKSCRYGIWDGNDSCLNEEFGNIILHRSLPHGKHRHFFNISDYSESFTALGFKVSVIIVTRDQTISLTAKSRDHQTDTKLAVLEHTYGSRILKNFVHQRSVACQQQTIRCSLPFIFSYESFVLLRRSYLEFVLQTIGIPIEQVSTNTDSLTIPTTNILDGNAKYLEPLNSAVCMWWLYSST